MNSTDVFGWAAAGLTFGTFACRDMARLRALAVLANLAFITYGAMAGLWPVLALHLALLPVNLRRLAEQRRLLAGLQLNVTGGSSLLPLRRAALVVLGSLALYPSGSALAVSAQQRAYAHAVESFQQGRFPEAYGRFVQLANAGHAPAARVALWMCEQGPDLFGKDWDCSPDEVLDWAALARVQAPSIGPRSYPIVAGKPSAGSKDARASLAKDVGRASR